LARRDHVRPIAWEARRVVRWIIAWERTRLLTWFKGTEDGTIEDEGTSKVLIEGLAEMLGVVVGALRMKVHPKVCTMGLQTCLATDFTIEGFTDLLCVSV
jgi:hypothetical protein